MIKYLLFLLFTLSSCGDLPPGSNNNPIQYLECSNVPYYTITYDASCPGANATWNNYKIVRASDNKSILSIKLYCGELEYQLLNGDLCMYLK